MGVVEVPGGKDNHCAFVMVIILDRSDVRVSRQVERCLKPCLGMRIRLRLVLCQRQSLLTMVSFMTIIDAIIDIFMMAIYCNHLVSIDTGENGDVVRFIENFLR